MLHFAFLFPFNLRTRSPSASYLTGHLTQKAPHELFSKKDKTGHVKLHGFYSRNNSECIQCELLPLGNLFPSGSLKLERN